MAVLGKIRKRVGLLIGFVGVSMVLFILGDLVTSNSGFINQNSDEVGEIAGEKIHYQEFEKRVETLVETYKTNSKKETVDPSTQEMLREQAWSMYVNEIVLVEEYKKLGISCSNDELYEMCTGRNPNPQIRQAFTDPNTGVFDPNTVIRFLKDLPNREEAVQKQWKTFEEALREERISEKYKNLIKGGLFITSEEARRGISDMGRSATIRFVRLDYNTIPDSSVKFDDGDLNAYYKENKNKFKQPETIRRAEYITFDVMPSEEDRNSVNTWANTKKEEFAQSTDDALFVAQNSDMPYDSTYHAKGTLKADIDSVLFHSSIGTIVGPMEDGNSIKIWKLTGEKMISDSVKARHILLKIENTDTASVMARADSLKNAIKRGSKFENLAPMFSQDPGSAIKGGDLGWFRPGMMVPEFNDACFDGKKGDMPIVKSQFGVHLIEIMEKGPATKQIRVGVVERKFEPSQKTYDLAYNKANEFAARNTTAETFQASIIKEGLNKRIADNVRETDKNIPGLDQPRELIRWIYTAKPGDVSKVFTIGDKYVIAQLTDVREKGYLPLASVKDQVTAEVRKRKKAEMLAEKFEQAGTTIDAIAQKLNVTPADADNITFTNPYINGIGNEPLAVGTIFGHKAGEITKPIKGETGVCVVQIKTINEPPLPPDVSFKIKELNDQFKSRSDYEVFNALKENSNIVDNRGKFY